MREDKAMKEACRTRLAREFRQLQRRPRHNTPPCLLSTICPAVSVSTGGRNFYTARRGLRQNAPSFENSLLFGNQAAAFTGPALNWIGTPRPALSPEANAAYRNFWKSDPTRRGETFVFCLLQSRSSGCLPSPRSVRFRLPHKPSHRQQSRRAARTQELRQRGWEMRVRDL